MQLFHFIFVSRLLAVVAADFVPLEAWLTSKVNERRSKDADCHMWHFSLFRLSKRKIYNNTCEMKLSKVVSMTFCIIWDKHGWKKSRSWKMHWLHNKAVFQYTSNLIEKIVKCYLIRRILRRNYTHMCIISWFFKTKNSFNERSFVIVTNMQNRLIPSVDMYVPVCRTTKCFRLSLRGPVALSNKPLQRTFYPHEVKKTNSLQIFMSVIQTIVLNVSPSIQGQWFSCD